MPKSKKPVVIITGVSSGIGLESAKLFSTNGWLVVGTVRSRKLPEELATHAIDTQIAEMSRPADLARVVDRTVKTYGRIDAVVANAGYGLWGRLPELTYAQVTAQLEVNLGAAAELIRLALPAMRQRGVVVAVSSVVGLVGLPEAPIYAASKQGLEGLMESLWFDKNLDGMRFRLIEPGPTSSPFWQNRIPGGARVRKPSVLSRSTSVWQSGSSSRQVAETILAATMSSSGRLRYPVGNAVRGLTLAKRLLPEMIFRSLIRRYLSSSNYGYKVE